MSIAVPTCALPCLNGAACVNGRCLCPEGFLGQQCDVLSKWNIRLLSRVKSNSYSNTKCFFITFWHEHFCFWGHECLFDRSVPNAISRAMPLHEFLKKKFNFQERFTLMIYYSIGHLKKFYMSVLCSVVALSLNGNTAAHCSALKNVSVLVWI